MPCILCEYFQAQEPREHQEQRIAGTCREHCGGRWDQDTAVFYVERHHKYLNGWCRLNPQPVSRSCADVCGQISLNKLAYFIDGFKPPGTDRYGLLEWSKEQMDTLINGSWRTKHTERLETDVKELQRQLKAARARSAARLEQIKKLKARAPKATELICDQVIEQQCEVIQLHKPAEAA